MIKFINADFRDILPDIVGQYADRKIIVVSDPPFNIGYRYNTYRDNLPDAEYQKLMYDAFGGQYASVVIHYPETLYRIARTIGKYPDKVVSWVYNSNTAKQHRDIAFFGISPDFNKVKQPYKNPTDKRVKALIASGRTGGRLYDWWNINQIKNVSKEKTKHNCQMPVEVMKNIIGILPDDALIVDPFAGSGTTGIACKFYNRDFIGIDIDKEYCEIANERLNATDGDR